MALWVPNGLDLHEVQDVLKVTLGAFSGVGARTNDALHGICRADL